jgi:uncharacterized protein
MYSAGLGVARDDAEAVKFYRRACDAGYSQGCSSAAFMYAEGRGVPHDDIRAAECY